MPEGEFQEEKYKAFVAKMDKLTKVYTENTVQTKKLIRILQAAGFSDPEEVAQAARTGLRPAAPQTPASSAFNAIAGHLMRAFPPDDLRDMAEEFLDGFVRNARRRRR